MFPLGALSIIVSAILAHFLLNEKLRRVGVLGCVLCIMGSTVIVVHAPAEHAISSVEEIWDLATQPTFLLYTASAIAVVLVLVLYCEPRYGQTNMMVYIGVCSINGSITTAAARGQVEPNDVWCMTNKMKGTSLFASICTPTGQCTTFHVGVVSVLSIP